MYIKLILIRQKILYLKQNNTIGIFAKQIF